MKKSSAAAPQTDLPAEAPIARSVLVAQKGIRTSADFMNFMSELITDLGNETVRPEIANAQCNAGGKLLKMVELEQKYGLDRSEELPTVSKKLLHLTR